MDSLERVSDTLRGLEGASQECPKEAYALLEDGVLDGGPLNAERAVGEATLEITIELSFSARLAKEDPHRLKGLGRLVLN